MHQVTLSWEHKDDAAEFQLLVRSIQLNGWEPGDPARLKRLLEMARPIPPPQPATRGESL